MWIDIDQHAGKFRPPLFAPNPRKSQEKALLGSVAGDFLRGLAGLVFRDQVLEGHQGYARTAIVSSVFAQSQLPVELEIIDSDEIAVLVRNAGGALLEFRA